jgi:hypothetical protein
MRKLLIAALLVLSLVAPACSNGNNCMCPGNGKNPACQGC